MVADPRTRLSRQRPAQLTLGDPWWAVGGVDPTLLGSPPSRWSTPGFLPGQSALVGPSPGRRRPIAHRSLRADPAGARSGRGGQARPDVLPVVPSSVRRTPDQGVPVYPSPVGPPSARVPPAGPASRPPGAGRSALDLLAQARVGLAEATELGPAGERYAGAHLAALRGTAAVLAARAHPQDPPHARANRRRLRNAWDLLCEVAPELAEWAGFFAAGATKRAAAEAGVARAVSAREADDLVRDVQTFLAVVATTVGAPPPGGRP